MEPTGWPQRIKLLEPTGAKSIDYALILTFLSPGAIHSMVYLASSLYIDFFLS